MLASTRIDSDEFQVFERYDQIGRVHFTVHYKDSDINFPCELVTGFFGDANFTKFFGGADFIDSKIPEFCSKVRKFCSIVFEPNPKGLINVRPMFKLRQMYKHFFKINQEIPGTVFKMGRTIGGYQALWECNNGNGNQENNRKLLWSAIIDLEDRDIITLFNEKTLQHFTKNGDLMTSPYQTDRYKSLKELLKGHKETAFNKLYPENNQERADATPDNGGHAAASRSKPRFAKYTPEFEPKFVKYIPKHMRLAAAAGDSVLSGSPQQKEAAAFKPQGSLISAPNPQALSAAAGVGILVTNSVPQSTQALVPQKKPAPSIFVGPEQAHSKQIQIWERFKEFMNEAGLFEAEYTYKNTTYKLVYKKDISIELERNTQPVFGYDFVNDKLHKDNIFLKGYDEQDQRFLANRLAEFKKKFPKP